MAHIGPVGTAGAGALLLGQPNFFFGDVGQALAHDTLLLVVGLNGMRAPVVGRS